MEARRGRRRGRTVARRVEGGASRLGSGCVSRGYTPNTALIIATALTTPVPPIARIPQVV